MNLVHRAGERPLRDVVGERPEREGERATLQGWASSTLEVVDEADCLAQHCGGAGSQAALRPSTTARYRFARAFSWCPQVARQ